MNRRDLLKLLAAGSIGSLIPSPGGARSTRHHPDDRARYFVLVHLSGGIDAVFTTDPRVKSDVASGVDVPYRADAISSFGDHVVGPHLALAGDAVKQLTIINGVHTHVLNHVSGSRQLLRMKIGADGRMPTLLHILGAQRDTQPVGELYVNVDGSSNGVFAPHFLGSVDGDTDFYDLVEATSGDDLRRLARIYGGQASRLARGDRLSHEQLATASNITDCARFFERVADVAPMKREDWYSDRYPNQKAMWGYTEKGIAYSFQRILWALENDLASCVVAQQDGWDTHLTNTLTQSRLAGWLYPALARFIDGLRTRRNRHGSLLDNTVVVLASELGRFPRLNLFDGKDHLPEAPMILLGKKLRKGVFGATGKLMEAQPISFETGRAQQGGERVMLDDVSATLLSMAGIDPISYGYTGRPLEFMTA